MKSKNASPFIFEKYSATGNDFIVIDNREAQISSFNPEFWSSLCARRQGIGADGVLFLESSPEYDYHMRYFNADGNEVAMCGNGARALYDYVCELTGKDGTSGLIFSTQHGCYRGIKNSKGLIGIKMTEFNEPGTISIEDLYVADFSLYLEVGVPHALFFISSGLDNLDINLIAPKIRHHPRFKNGCNINFIEICSNNILSLRTYERGVEGETLACGTGATAAVLAYMKWKNIPEGKIKVKVPGGELIVERNKQDEVWLWGEVKRIYSGEWKHL